MCGKKSKLQLYFHGGHYKFRPHFVKASPSAVVLGSSIIVHAVELTFKSRIVSLREKFQSTAVVLKWCAQILCELKLYFCLFLFIKKWNGEIRNIIYKKFSLIDKVLKVIRFDDTN